MKKILALLCISALSLGFSAPAFSISHHKDDNFINVTKKTKHLRSRLSKEYTGYVYTIENISDEPVYIENISTKDTLTSDAAYLSVKRSSLSTGAKTIGTGLVYAIPTITLSLFGSVILAPIKMVGNTCGNIGAKQEGKRYDIAPASATLNPGESVTVKTLAVHRHAPEINVLYKTEKNNDLTHFDL